MGTCHTRSSVSFPKGVDFLLLRFFDSRTIQRNTNTVFPSLSPTELRRAR